MLCRWHMWRDRSHQTGNEIVNIRSCLGIQTPTKYRMATEKNLHLLKKENKGVASVENTSNINKLVVWTVWHVHGICVRCMHVPNRYIVLCAKSMWYISSVCVHVLICDFVYGHMWVWECVYMCVLMALYLCNMSVTWASKRGKVSHPGLYLQEHSWKSSFGKVTA